MGVGPRARLGVGPQRIKNADRTPLIKGCAKNEDTEYRFVGYGFMGRTHSNAFLPRPAISNLPYKPVLKAVAARKGHGGSPASGEK